jgi:hypothetical protein
MDCPFFTKILRDSIMDVIEKWNRVFTSVWNRVQLKKDKEKDVWFYEPLYLHKSDYKRSEHLHHITSFGRSSYPESMLDAVREGDIIAGHCDGGHFELVGLSTHFQENYPEVILKKYTLIEYANNSLHTSDDLEALVALEE